MIEVKGKAGIIAKILADSVNEQGNRLVTYEITYPRIIHSELLTHKMLCSNSASSRAIPFAKMAEQLTAQPVRFGQANPGMQDKGEDFKGTIKVTCPDGDAYEFTPEEVWEMARKDATSYAKFLKESDFHKQVYNRLTEPFQMMKTVISGTEWENFFWLRNDSAADPTLHELARCVQEARDESVPQLLKAGEWHLPYVLIDYEDGKQVYMVEQEVEGWGTASYYMSLENAIKVSCARTAAVSFRNEDYGLEKCLEVYARLIGDERKHASAMAHAATPMQNKQMHKALSGCINYVDYPDTWELGVSHATRDGKLWSAQYCGWIMHRKTIPGENYTK